MNIKQFPFPKLLYYTIIYDAKNLILGGRGGQNRKATSLLSSDTTQPNCLQDQAQPPPKCLRMLKSL